MAAEGYPLLHSPAEIIAQLMIDIGVGSDPDNNVLWPIFVSNEPTSPDNIITSFDTSPVLDGRSMVDGEGMLHQGIMVRVRGYTHQFAYKKVEEIRVKLNAQVVNRQVILDGTAYLVRCVTSGRIMNLGEEEPDTKRRLFSLNFMSSIDRYPE